MKTTPLSHAAPGNADSPGPIKVPAEQLKSLLGITDVNFIRGKQALGLGDSTVE